VTAPARALVVTHSQSEGPGTLAQWLPAAGVELDLVSPWQGDKLRGRLDGHDALVVLGGPQSAYDDHSAPWLPATKQLLRTAVSVGLPTLGICLGAQLLAEATGGRVAKGSAGIEAGPRLVAKRDAAWQDPLFDQVPLTPTVVQWHEDAVVELPPAALLLASSSKYVNQAFRVGPCAWGLQFHIETPAAMVRYWGEHYSAAVLAAGLDPRALAERAVAELDEVEACWRPAVERFAALAQGRVRTSLPLVER